MPGRARNHMRITFLPLYCSPTSAHLHSLLIIVLIIVLFHLVHIVVLDIFPLSLKLQVSKPATLQSRVVPVHLDLLNPRSHSSPYRKHCIINQQIDSQSHDVIARTCLSRTLPRILCLRRPHFASPACCPCKLIYFQWTGRSVGA
jgi:hypothetical protein